MENHLDINSQFIPYNLSLKLKELGFDEECFGFYNNADGNVWIKHLIPDDIKEIYTGDISAPLWQQAFDWFREEKKLISGITCYNKSWVEEYQLAEEFEPFIINDKLTLWNDAYKTYEEARLECLKKLIEMVSK